MREGEREGGREGGNEGDEQWICRGVRVGSRTMVWEMEGKGSYTLYV